MADAVSQQEFPELLAVVEERDLPYPLVAINGSVRAAGSAHYYHVLPYVEEVLKPDGTDPEGGRLED